MGHERVRELVKTLVRVRVRVRRPTQQRQPHHRVMDVIAMLAIVEQRHAVMPIAQVGPALRAHLEHRPRLGRLHVRRPPDVPELDFVGRLLRTDCHGERDLENLVPLVPVGSGIETQHARAGLERDGLFEDRFPKAPVEGDRDERVAMLDVEIPGIPPARVVVVELENVAGAAQDLAFHFFVPDRRQRAAVVPLDAEEFVFQGLTRD